MNRYLVVTLIAVVAIFLSRGQKFYGLDPNSMTKQELTKVLESTDNKVLLYFWQPKCASSTLMNPLVDEVARDYAKKMTVVKIDTTKPVNKAVHDAYDISATPTFVVIQKGKVVSQWVGPFKDKNLLLTFLRPSGAY